MFRSKQIKINAIDTCLKKDDKFVIVFISGTSGSGKTILANTIAKSYEGFTRRYIDKDHLDWLLPDTKYKYDYDLVEIFDNIDYLDDVSFERILLEPFPHKKLIRIVCTHLHPNHEKQIDKVTTGCYPWNSFKDQIIRCYTSSEVSFARDVLHDTFGDIVYEFHRKCGQALLDSMITRPVMVSYDGFTEILRFSVREGWRPEKRKVEPALF